MPAPEFEADTIAHGYAKGSARLHVPFVYHVQKGLQSESGDLLKIDGVKDAETTTSDKKSTSSAGGRTLVSLPNNPFARLSPLKADYYKYGKSPVKGYLPKSFLRLEKLRDVKVATDKQRSMLVFE